MHRLDVSTAQTGNKGQRTPGEVVGFSLRGKPEEVGCHASKEHKRGSNGVGELSIRCEGRQRGTFLPSISLYLGCHWKVLPIFRMGFPTSNDLTKNSSQEYQALPFS